MNTLFGFLGRGGGLKDFPYNIGEPYGPSWGAWTHLKGTSKEDNSPVSIFQLTGANAGDSRLQAARNGVKRLRTMRHPHVLAFLHSTETEVIENGVSKPVIYMVTEPVMPLAEKIKELNLKGAERDEYFAWGLFGVTKAVSFLNNDCKLVHGNVCVASLVATPTLDWKLHALDVMSEFDAGTPKAEGPGAPPMLPNEWLIGAQYKPMELAKCDWEVIRRSPPWALDAWGLGCLIQELFTGAPLKRTEDLRNTAPIPKGLLPEYQRLLGSTPNRRLNPSKLVDSEFFQNRLVETIQFMEVLNLKDSMEKETFFRKLPTLVEQLPRPIVVKKILPLVCGALEFGSASALALQPLFKMGAWLPQDEFNTKVLPTVTKLFASQDRAVRIGLLQNIDAFGSSLAGDTMDTQVFNHVASGFSDTSPFLRELTLKSMLIIAPKLTQKTLTSSLLKYLSKLQVDEEPAIRTNTTILLGNIARHLNDATRKRILVNAFTRALRDQFPPARSAGLMALMATKEYYDVAELGTRILPAVVVLSIDGDGEVRSKAFHCVDTFLANLRAHFDEETSFPPIAAPSTEKTTGGSALLGWAVGSIMGKPAASKDAIPGTTGSMVQTVMGASAAASASASAGAGAPSFPSRRPSMAKSAAPQIPASSGSSDVWNHDLNDNNEAERDEGDGWDDMEPFEAQTSAPPRQATFGSAVRGAASASQAQPSALGPSNGDTSPKGMWGSDEGELWGDISVPEPAPMRKPFSSQPRPSSSGSSGSSTPTARGTAPASRSLSGRVDAASSRPLSGRAAGTSGATQTGHVALPAAVKSADLSLESMLGNTMMGGGKPVASGQHVSLDSVLGKKKAPMKLGAQRLPK